MIRHKRVPYIPQMEMVECGAASLAMVLAYWGHFAPLSEIREACKVSRDGANAGNILEAARSHGLDAEAVKVELENIGDLPLPAILHWEFRHFVVLERLTPKGAVIVDPARGRHSVPNAEMDTCFTGVALVFAPEDDFQIRPRKLPSISRYMQMIREHRKSLGQLLGASLMLQIAGLVLPMSTQLLVDRVLVPKHLPWLWGLAIALTLAMVLRLVLNLLRSYVLQGLQNVMDRTLMENFVRHLISLPLNFFLQRQPGDLLQRVESNAQLRDLFSNRSVSAVLDIFLLLGFTGLMLAYHVPLACAVIVLSLMRVGLLVHLRARNEQLMTTELAAAGQERATLVESLSSLETVKASFSQDRILGLWFPRFVRRLNVSMERQRLVLASTQAMTALQGIATATVFWIGGKEVFSEHITLGVFTAFLALQGLFLGPLESMLGAITEFQFLLSHLQRMDDVLETPSEPNGHFDPGKLRGEIVLENVRFRYSPGSPYIIRDISLRIAPGEKVALVGSTGAGKSTLARLLMGMHLPTEGRIYFDGHDLRVLDLDSLRRQLGVVLQDSFLFDDTVRANLALRDPEIPLQRLRGAAKLACVDQVIDRLPDGYKTMLGENGRSLSGGERQRLCLARALALDPAILLLDEATSSLDLETEAEVHANLARFGCTRIVIAHRLETVKDAHRILVLKDGTLVQEGTYAELTTVPGPFRDLATAMEASRA